MLECKSTLRPLKVCCGGGGGARVIIVSALSLRDKERLRDRGSLTKVGPRKPKINGCDYE